MVARASAGGGDDGCSSAGTTGSSAKPNTQCKYKNILVVEHNKLFPLHKN
jgi:hypothetical protein